MKIPIALFTLLALGSSAPQPRKLFHEHMEDFLDIIMDDTFDEFEHLMSHYVEFDEFKAALEYITSTNFKDLVYEMESLPEFQAVVEFLEKDNIDIHYFIDIINEMLDNLYTLRSRQLRHDLSGTDFSAFINDYVATWPKEKLAGLFDHKMEEDAEFKSAIDNLWSEEWQNLYNALWASPTFQQEVTALEANGISMEVLHNQIKAIFGQK